MKKIRILLLCWLSVQSIYAQNITHIEYFIDNDTGYGNGTPVSFAAGSNINTNFIVNIPGTLTDGFHFLSVRAKDETNKWSIVGWKPFYNLSISNDTLADINIIEYFIDTDPGYGNGTSVSFTVSSSITQSFQIPIPSNLPEGFHFLSIRAKDANNKWSIVGIRPFYKQSLPNSALPDIVALEYFIDTDPGYGNGTAIAITAGTTVDRNFLLDIASVSNGDHILFIRARDANNKWSAIEDRNFTVQDNVIIVQNMSAQWCATTNFDIPFIIYGTYAVGNVFTALLSDANGSFDSPTNIGTLNGTGSGTIVANIPDTISIGNGYKIKVVSSDPSIENNPEKSFELLSVCPPPCPGILTLQSWDDDYLSGNIVKEANISTGTIVAGNQIRNNANVIYRSGKSITFNPGFSVNSGAVFKTEFGGCN